MLALLALPGAAQQRERGAPPSVLVVDDFERDKADGLPGKWRFLTSKKQEYRPLEPFLGEREYVVVQSEKGNKHLRAYTRGEALRITIPHTDLTWDLKLHPRLQWEWRALRLPTGAREDRVNDSGGAMYVSFDKTDWLGRPYSIKYTYSTTLPVGTVVSTGNVKIIVASSGVEGLGRWVRVERDVVEDYRRLFGSEPTNPLTVTIWSDSDNTNSVAEVDFDDIKLLPRR